MKTKSTPQVQKTTQTLTQLTKLNELNFEINQRLFDSQELPEADRIIFIELFKTNQAVSERLIEEIKLHSNDKSLDVKTESRIAKTFWRVLAFIKVFDWINKSN